MRTEVSAISFIGTSLLDEGWCSCSPPRACAQGCSGLFLHGSLPRHARCATRGSIETSLLLRNKRDDQRYESSLDSDNLLCAVCLCILSDTMRNGMCSISHGALEKMGGTCPSKLCRTYPLCGYEGRSLTLGHLDSSYKHLVIQVCPTQQLKADGFINETRGSKLRTLLLLPGMSAYHQCRLHSPFA